MLTEKQQCHGSQWQPNDNSSNGAGAVYVFNRIGDFWSQQAYLKASNTDSGIDAGSGDGFGYSISLSANGNTLAVSAWDEESSATGVNGDQDNNDTLASGAVYVFIRSGTHWIQQAYLKASNTDLGDYFGYHISLSADGSTLAVGAVGEDSSATGSNGDQSDNSAERSGAVYLY